MFLLPTPPSSQRGRSQHVLGFDIGNGLHHSQAVANTVPGGAWLELGYEDQKGQNCEILGYPIRSLGVYPKSITPFSVCLSSATHP